MQSAAASCASVALGRTGDVCRPPGPHLRAQVAHVDAFLPGRTADLDEESLRLGCRRLARVVEERIELAFDGGGVGRCVIDVGREREHGTLIEEHVHQLPEHVIERLVHFLHDEAVRAGDGEDDVGIRRACVVGPKQDRQHATRTARGERLEDRLGRRRCAQGEDDVVRRPERADRARERAGGDLGREAGEDTRVGRERDGRERPLADEDGMDELHGDVLGIARLRALAAHQQRAAPCEPTGHALADVCDRIGMGSEERPRRADARREVSIHDLGQLGAQRRRRNGRR
jgi:hypothetical protein